MFCRKHFLWWPTTLDPHAQRAMSDAQFARPCPERHGFAVVGKHPGLASVLALFKFRSPSAIRRGIRAVVVDSVDGCFWERLQSHVGKEVDKRGSPAVADHNSTTAVEMILAVARVVAASLHFLPCDVFGGSMPTTLRLSSTAAGFGSSITLSKVATRSGSRVAAFALTKPVRVTGLSFSSEADDGQQTVDVSSFVCCSTRKLGRIARSHLTLLFSDMVVRAVQKHQLPVGSFHFAPKTLCCQS